MGCLDVDLSAVFRDPDDLTKDPLHIGYVFDNVFKDHKVEAVILKGPWELIKVMVYINPVRLYQINAYSARHLYTAVANVDGGEAWGTGATMVDVDNDGDLDIFVCNYDSPCALYLNQGDGHFVEDAKRFGLDVVDASLSPVFCDYDCDGDLDLYLLTNRYYRAGGRPRKAPYKMQDGVRTILPEFEKYYTITVNGSKTFSLDNKARPDLLFRNDGNRGFRNVTGQAGIAGGGHGL